MIDLGAWASEAYRLPADAGPDEQDSVPGSDSPADPRS